MLKVITMLAAIFIIGFSFAADPVKGNTMNSSTENSNENLLGDDPFEADHIALWSGAPNKYFSLVDNAQSGKPCLMVKGEPVNPWLYTCKRVNATLAPGEKYLLKADVLSSVNSGSAWFGFFLTRDNFKTSLEYKKIKVGPVGDKWKKLESVIKVDSQTTEFTIYICCEKVNGSFLIDNISLTKVLPENPASTASVAPAWETRLSEEGEGTVESQGDIVTIRKTNPFGFVAAQYNKKMKVEKGKKYYAFCEYQTTDALQNSILMIKLISDKNDPYTFREIDGGWWVWPQYYSIRNTPDNLWDTRYTTFTADSTEYLYFTVAAWGNPFTARIKNIQLKEMPVPPVPEPKLENYANRYTREQVDEHLKIRQNAEAAIGNYNGRKAILINGKLDSVAIYKGLGVHGANRGLDIAHFGDIGINMVVRNLATGKISDQDVHGFWTGKKQYDFSRVDEVIYDTLQKNPDACIILDLYVRPYPGWANKHSMSEVYVNSKGEYAYGPGLYDSWTADKSVVESPGSGKYWIPSWTSEIFLQDMAEMVADTFNYIKTKPYYKAVIGAHFTGGDDGQFGARDADHSESSKAAYRRFLKSKYTNIENLNKTWGKTYASFDEVSIPQEEDLNTTILNKAAYQTADYNDLKMHLMYNFRDKLAQAVKDNIGKKAICTTYGIPSGDNFADYKSMDAQCFQPGYPSRKPGVPTVNFPRTLFHRPDKAFIAEFDSRGLPDAGADRFYHDGVGWQSDMKMWGNAHKKLIGQIITKGYIYWYYDMNQYYNTPDFRAEIKETETILKKLYSKPKTQFKPDVCVVMSSREQEFCNTWTLLTEHINYNPQYQEFELSGVPMDKVYISELEKYPDLCNYKVLIFFQNTYLTEKDKTFINQVLKKNGRTIIWIYNPGYITDNAVPDKQTADKKFSDLIGMNIAYDGTLSNLTPYYLQNATYMNGTPGSFCGSRWLSTILTSIPGWETFRITDDTVEVIAKYKEDNTIAGGIKKYKDWTSVYLAAPQSLHGSIINNIAKDKGCYVAAGYGQQIDIDGDFASVHGIIAQDNYTINLPKGKSRIYDAITGRLLADNIKTYSFPVKAWETYWFTFE